MEPQIRYAKTSDGVSIAYYAIGEGPAVLFLAMPFSHLEAEWQIDPLRMAYTAVAQWATLVRLDPRGFGLSDRDPDDFALDSFVLDIEAVVDRLGLEELRIYSLGFATIPALAYTARHPDKVTHLAQAPAAASWEDMSNERMLILTELAKIDWELASETAVRSFSPDFTDQLVSDFAGLIRATGEVASFERLAEDARRWDADADATSLSTPTLLIHQRNNPNSSMDATRRVAGLIKDSRVAFVDNAFEGPLLAQRFFEGDIPDLTEPASVQTATPPEAATVHTILFTDVEGSTALTERLGDAKARELLREHERMVREALKSHSGSEVKTMGDGFMASFSSATRALECAIAMQRAFAEWNEGWLRSKGGSSTGSGRAEVIRVRIGLNAGEPIAEDDPDGRSDLFGTAVNRAARITATAKGGEILVANVVRELAEGKDFLFADRGETSLKGFDEPVRLYEVRWGD
ncbi:MAG: adenylate/guanylate cyclase domain-containing protein [Chloroflexi bacterium]|nr:adenylate/guanylate cyclase domain-containing protein [Chloroflexota bacterium]